MDQEIDRFKNIVDNIFDRLESPTNKKKVNSDALNIQPVELTSKDEEFAKVKALEELESIRLEFLAFQDRVRELMMFNYLTSQFMEFADHANDLVEVIEDEIDESKLTPESLKKYQRIKKLRAQILTNIYNKYNKGGN